MSFLVLKFQNIVVVEVNNTFEFVAIDDGLKVLMSHQTRVLTSILTTLIYIHNTSLCNTNSLCPPL